MKISDVGLGLIKRWEGLRLKAYQCVAGVWTIGYGHTAGVKEGDTCSVAQAEKMLSEDLEAFEAAVNAYNEAYHWTQNQFDALVSFTYNCGKGNLKLLLSDGNKPIDQVASDILLYNKAGGQFVTGLQNRRNEEHALFCKVAGSIGDYYPAPSLYDLSIDTIFELIGAKADYDTSKHYLYSMRKPIADANGITGYVGSFDQNMRLIQLAITGQLRRPNT